MVFKKRPEGVDCVRIIAKHEMKDGEKLLKEIYPNELGEVLDVIYSVNAENCLKKISKEKTMPGEILYSPKCLNKSIKEEFSRRGWNSVRVRCKYDPSSYLPDYSPPGIRRAYREIDFVKNKVGIEVQLGKYAFMVYNVAAKMTIFHNLGFIDIGIEIVPAKELQGKMSTGVSYFEQLVWDLRNRGEADIDIPVLVLGVVSNGK